jgi:hypothetical protein
MRIKKQLQQSSANQLLAGLKKRVPSAGGKSCSGIIAMFNCLFVLASIFLLHLPQNQIEIRFNACYDLRVLYRQTITAVTFNYSMTTK